MKRSRWIFLMVATILLSACRSTKYVSEGDYLLNKVNIEVVDNGMYTGQFTPLLRQKPNSKIGLHLYSLSGRDTSKWVNRFLRRIGSEPVIYDPEMTLKTQSQIRKELQNLGYLNAEVGACLNHHGKKVDVTYCLRAKERYTIRHSENGVEPSSLHSLIQFKSIRKLLEFEEKEPFVAARLDNASADILEQLRNQGYYYLNKDNFYFLADTTVGDHQVDVTLKYRPTRVDTATGKDLALQRYRIRDVVVSNTYSPGNDTLTHKKIKVLKGKETFIRPSIIYYNNFIRPGRFYSDLLMEKTYTSLHALSAVDQVSVNFVPVPEDSSSLDARISLSPANIYHFQFGIDGTNNAGDLGVASYITFSDKNIFRGSETLRLRLNGAYEHISGSDDKEVTLLSNNFYEYGAELSLSFPRIIFGLLPEKYTKQVGSATSFSVSINWQNRPEYNRRVLGLNWGYSWKSHRQRMSHNFDLYNINYVITRDMSDWFKAYLERGKNALLKESYMDQFITRTDYSFVYTSNRKAAENGFTLRGGLDMAGTLPFLVCKIAKVEKKLVSEDDETSVEKYKIFDTPFAQYVKGTFDASKIFLTKRNNQFVMHAGFGLACPYLNSDVLPYEQRFFAGGPNTVRGWSTRTLGPGRYNSGVKSDFLQRTGDVKLVFNLEYRYKLASFLELAAFTDAGNIWTVKSYKNQPAGQFNIKDFYKELGWSVGLGLRPNLSFLILRFDAGMQLYDPANPMEGAENSSKWVITHPVFKDNFALHFAVGYPF